MAVSSSAVALNASTPTALNAPQSDPCSLLVHNADGSIVVYLGGSDVTTSNGVPLAAGVKQSVNNLAGGERLYAIAASGTPSVRVLKQG